MTYVHDAGRFGDPAARADWIRDELRDSFSCQTCGSPDPAIIEGKWCCDCVGVNAAAFEVARAVRIERDAS